MFAPTNPAFHLRWSSQTKYYIESSATWLPCKLPFELGLPKTFDIFNVIRSNTWLPTRRADFDAHPMERVLNFCTLELRSVCSLAHVALVLFATHAWNVNWTRAPLPLFERILDDIYEIAFVYCFRCYDVYKPKMFTGCIRGRKNNPRNVRCVDW